MRWALLALFVVVLVAIVSAGEHKQHKTKKELEAKHTDFKENHGKKCHGKKCGGAEKYSKGKNKKAEVVDALESAEEVKSSRGKRDAVEAVEAAKPRKHKKVSSQMENGKKSKKTKRNAENYNPEGNEVGVDAEPQDTAKVRKEFQEDKKSKRSTGDIAPEDVPLSAKASKGKKKKATESELYKKNPSKKSQKTEQPKDEAVAAENAANDGLGVGEGPSGVKVAEHQDVPCVDEQCTDEE